MEKKITILEKEISELKEQSMIPFIQRLATDTHEEIKKETDQVRLETLHGRLQRYIELGIRFNESLKF